MTYKVLSGTLSLYHSVTYRKAWLGIKPVLSPVLTSTKTKVVIGRREGTNYVSGWWHIRYDVRRIFYSGSFLSLKMYMLYPVNNTANKFENQNNIA